MAVQTRPVFKNFIAVLDINHASEDALVELAGMVPVLRPLVENAIDMDAPRNRHLHRLLGASDDVLFLRNNLAVLNPTADIGSGTPQQFQTPSLVKNEDAETFVLTLPISCDHDEKTRNRMLYNVLPAVMRLLSEKTPAQTTYEFWPRD